MRSAGKSQRKYGKSLTGGQWGFKGLGPFVAWMQLGHVAKKQRMWNFSTIRSGWIEEDKKGFLRFFQGKTVDLWSLRREQWLDGTPVAPLGFYHRQFTD